MLMFLEWSVCAETWFLVLHWHLCVFVIVLWLSLNPVQTWQSICHKLWSFSFSFSWLTKLWHDEWHLKANMPCCQAELYRWLPSQKKKKKKISLSSFSCTSSSISQIFYDVVMGQVFLFGYSVWVCPRKTCFEMDMFVFVQCSLS